MALETGYILDFLALLSATQRDSFVTEHPPIHLPSGYVGHAVPPRSPCDSSHRGTRTSSPCLEPTGIEPK